MSRYEENFPQLLCEMWGKVAPYRPNLWKHQNFSIIHNKTKKLSPNSRLNHHFLILYPAIESFCWCLTLVFEFRRSSIREQPFDGRLSQFHPGLAPPLKKELFLRTPEGTEGAEAPQCHIQSSAFVSVAKTERLWSTQKSNWYHSTQHLK